MGSAWLLATNPPIAGSPLRGWRLRRKLSRKGWLTLARRFAKASLIRLTASIACLIAMVLIVWAAVVVRIIAVGGIQALQTLDTTQINGAPHQAAQVQSDLFPVLVVWAALLLVTPVGYVAAFRAAALSAGAVGYLNLVPPSFLVTRWVARVADSLLEAHPQRNPPIVLGTALGFLGLALLLLSIARRVFTSLEGLRLRPGWRVRAGIRSGNSASKLVAVPLIALILLLAIWAGTVVRLAATGATVPGKLAQDGSQAGAWAGDYLLAILLVAVVVPLLRAARPAAWMAVLCAGAIASIPVVADHSSALRIPLLTSQFTALGGDCGADSLWIALFAGVPFIVFGLYLADRMLVPAETRFF